MDPTPERLNAIKLYCRIDAEDTEEDALITGLCWAAVGYLAEAGITEPKEGTPRRAQYDLCVNYLVLDGYDRREVTLTGTTMIENPSFRRLLTQLKLTEPVSVSKQQTVTPIDAAVDAVSNLDTGGTEG